MDPRWRRRTATGGVLLAAIAALVACTHAHAATPKTEPVAATASTRSCGELATPGTSVVTIPVDGIPRHIRLYIPHAYRSDRRIPLVLNLHGSGSTAAHQESATGMDATAEAHRFLVAYPEGAKRSGSGFSWNIPGTPTYSAAGPDDIGYLDHIVTDLQQRYCADFARTFAVGFSGGARLVSQFACESGRPLAAAAAVGGLRAPNPCPAAPVPVLGIHGTADLQNPYAGKGQPYWTYSVPEAARRWGVSDGCATAPRVDRVSAGVSRTAYHDCRAGADVVLYSLSGRGHIWPTLARTGFDCDETVWSFFAAHPRRVSPAHTPAVD